MSSPFRSAGFRWFVLAPAMFAAFVASFLFVTFHLMRAAATPKRDRVVAELDAADPNWRTTDLTAARNAELPPPEQNAAELGYQAQQKLPKSYHDWDKKPNSGQWRSDLKNPHLPHRADVTDLRKQLQKAREAVELARGIRHIPGGGFPLVFAEPGWISTLLDKQQHLRQTMGLLQQDALVRAYDRDGTGALESCLAVLAVARGIGDEPTLISQLIRMAGVAICVGSVERTLGWCDGFDDVKLAELDRAFEQEAAEPRLLYGMRGERAGMYRLMENIDEGRMPAFTRMLDPRPAGPADFAGEIIIGATIREQQATSLELFNRMVAVAKMPPGPARAAALDPLELEMKRLPQWSNLLLRLLLPAIERMEEADTRCVATLNAARMAIACERHRLKTGAYPATLDELPKELLPEVPTDPFTGKPILYKRLDDGAVAYSASYDGADDGAVKLDPRNAQGNDIGFRLWTPAHRRKPPQSKSEATIFSPEFGIDPEPTPGKSTAPPPISPRVKEE